MITVALSMASMHWVTSSKQEVFEVRYVRGSEERRRIVKACHVDFDTHVSGHKGVKRTFHRVLERFFLNLFILKGCTKGYVESMVSIE